MAQEKPNETLVEALRDAGFNDSEIRVFTFLLRHDIGLRVSDIARRVRLNRTTLYGVLKALTDKGLVSSSEQRGVLLFRSIQPHLLVDYLERLQQRLASNIKKVEEIIPEITSQRTQEERYRPQMEFFDGTEGIKQAYEDTLRNNKDKTVYGLAGIHALYNLMGMDWIQYYLKKRSSMGVKWLALAVDSPTARAMQKRDKAEVRVTKFLPAEYKFDIELGSYDDNTLIVSFAEDHPWAMIIRDKKIAETVTALFRYIDKTLPDTAVQIKTAA